MFSAASDAADRTVRFSSDDAQGAGGESDQAGEGDSPDDDGGEDGAASDASGDGKAADEDGSADNADGGEEGR